MTRHKTFPQGGIHPHDHKITAGQPLVTLQLPKSVALILTQHIGAAAVPIVKVGDPVKTGQLLAEAKGMISAHVHATISGRVARIEDVMDQTGIKRPAVIIESGNEGRDDWAEGIDHSPDIGRMPDLSPDEIRARVRAAGIIGLGGAGFPAHVKLSVPPGKKAEFLLINGVECEPYLTSDHCLMMSRAQEILIGIRLSLHALGLTRAMIGIEENKPDAIALFESLLGRDQTVRVVPLKVCYPQGGERQLVKALINREIPPAPKGLPIDVGAVVLNVASCFAIYEAVVKNKPLIDRIVTVTGDGLASPGNFLVRIGTPIQALIEAAGGLPENAGKIISGGPMMGKAVSVLSAPVTKTTGGLVVCSDSWSHRSISRDCIRCGNCVTACPLGLEPYLLMTVTQKDLYDRAEQEKITNCCECACCCYVCPSHRPLLDYIRLGKGRVLQRMRERTKK